MLNIIELCFTEPGGGSKFPFLLLLKTNPAFHAQQNLTLFSLERNQFFPHQGKIFKFPCDFEVLHRVLIMFSLVSFQRTSCKWTKTNFALAKNLSFLFFFALPNMISQTRLALPVHEWL